MHALCRFFLNHVSPTHEMGDRRMLAFLVEMSSLFEMFAGAWIGQHLPSRLELRTQHSVPLDEGGKLRFRIDLVICDAETGRPLMVLDTKYKAPTSPSSEDIQQVVAYAESLGCEEAALVYPTDLEYPVSTRVGRIRVRTLTFDLYGEIDENGRRFLAFTALGRPAFAI